MFANHPDVLKMLESRIKNLAPFWFHEPHVRSSINPALFNKNTLIVDAEDSFTAMLAQQLSAVGCIVTIKSVREVTNLNDSWDLIVLGPGPGNPTDLNNEHVFKLNQLVNILIKDETPFFAICLSHQILCSVLNIPLYRLDKPYQGTQKKINLFDAEQYVGFYNTYMGKCDGTNENLLANKNIHVCYDTKNGEVFALRGKKFSSLQFHPESILTRNGVDIITESLIRIL